MPETGGELLGTANNSDNLGRTRGACAVEFGLEPGGDAGGAPQQHVGPRRRAGVDVVVAYWERLGRAATAGFPRPALPVADRGGVPDDMKSRFHGASA
jgi:hypothetical protein